MAPVPYSRTLPHKIHFYVPTFDLLELTSICISRFELLTWAKNATTNGIRAAHNAA